MPRDTTLSDVGIIIAAGLIFTGVVALTIVAFAMAILASVVILSFLVAMLLLLKLVWWLMTLAEQRELQRLDREMGAYLLQQGEEATPEDFKSDVVDFESREWQKKW